MRFTFSVQIPSQISSRIFYTSLKNILDKYSFLGMVAKIASFQESKQNLEFFLYINNAHLMQAHAQIDSFTRVKK